jgi:hypothetical protein
MKWLFLVSQVRTSNSRERVKVWRLTKKVGALLYRNSVYVLPYSKERMEDFQWLCQEIKDSKGDASTFISESNNTAENNALIRLFQESRTSDYTTLINAAHTMIARIQQAQGLSTSPKQIKKIDKGYKSMLEAFQEAQRLDFFNNSLSKEAKHALDDVRSQFSALRPATGSESELSIHVTREFQKKVWTTREHIHIDRVCSSWLIRRFIDPKAKFVFTSETKLPKNAIPFDAPGGEFGHHGDHCTFETLLRSFQLKDKALGEIAEIVHDIDLKDQKFKRPEASGIDAIIRSLSDSLQDDHKTVEIGSVILDALYERFSSGKKSKNG